MTVSHVASSGSTTTATAYGTTSTSVAYPASSVAAGRMAIIIASTKLSTATWNAVTGYTLIAEGTGGTGASSTTTGTTRIGVWYRILDGSETGSVTVGTGGVAATATVGVMSVYSRSNGQWETPFAVTASDTTDANSPSATASAWAKPLIPADMLIVGYAGEEGTTTAPGTNGLTQSGATFAARTLRNYRNNNSGDDNTVASYDGLVNSGSANALTMDITWTAITTAGAFVAVALRDSSLGLSNTFEGGTDGVTVTSGNSAVSGAPFDFVSIPATANITFESDAAARGTMGCSISAGGTAGTPHLEYTVGWNTASDSPIYGRLRFKVSTLPAAQIRLALIADGAGAFQADWRLNTNGTIGIYTGTGTLVATSTAAVTANQWFDLGISITVFSATVGQFEGKLYLNPSSDTATETLTATNRDTLRGGGRNNLQMGILTSVSDTTLYLDDIQWLRDTYPSALVMSIFGASTLSIESAMTTAALNRVNATSALSVQSNMVSAGRATQLAAISLSIASEFGALASVRVLGSAALSSTVDIAGIASQNIVNASCILSIQSNLQASVEENLPWLIELLEMGSVQMQITEMKSSSSINIEGS